MMNDERLIREIEKRTLFYDPKDLFYKDNVVKEKEWSTMAKSLGLDVEFCKARWKALRDGFVKCKNAQKEHRYGDKLSFLMPHLQPKRSKRYITCNPDLEGDGTSGGENGDLLAAAAASAEINYSSSTPPSQQQQEARPPENKVLKRSSSPCPYLSIPLSPKDVPQSDLDESYHFAMSLVPILSRMDRTTRRQAQVFILNGLGNFENPL